MKMTTNVEGTSTSKTTIHLPVGSALDSSPQEAILGPITDLAVRQLVGVYPVKVRDIAAGPSDFAGLEINHPAPPHRSVASCLLN